jgi:hypothetical protein
LPLVVLAVAGAAAWGVALRLVDPLSTDVIPAEDPYTHLALTREHLRDGDIDGLNGPETPYPPGLHAVLAAFTVYSGVALDDLVRFGPVAFGAIAVVGTALLLRRLDGNAAAVVGALVVAVTPELVFRSQMMAPTAMDLAFLPFVLLGLTLTVRGRLGWAAPTAVLLAFLLASHPWVFGILGIASAAFLLLAVACPWSERPRIDALGLALGILLVGASSAFALSGCWGTCGPGFSVVEEDQGADGRFDELAAGMLAATLAIAAACAFGRRGLQRALDGLRPLGRVGASAWSLLLVGLAGYAVWKAQQDGMPSQVSLEYMLGMPLLFVAAVGLAAVPWARRPGAHVAAALVAATLPFTVFDPFQSPFWPHRTAAYLGIGLALAAGVAAGASARLLAAIAAWSAQERPRKARSPWMRAVVPGLLVGTLLGAGLVTAAPQPYPPWYRLYDDCEANGLDEVAARADADPRLVVVAGSWQAKLVLAASADNASRIWFITGLYAKPQPAEDLVKFSDGADRPVLLVAERHALAAGGSNATLPPSPAWQPAGTWACTDPMTAYLHHPT